jgi:hypothetical protein
MAREAIARLYDVDKNSMEYFKPDKRGKYDYGRISFHAKDGKLVDLATIHESVWATRLSRGTGSALVNLDVTVAGSIVDDGAINLVVPGDRLDRVFTLLPYPKKDAKNGEEKRYDELVTAIKRGQRLFSISGRLDGWKGRWPGFLNQPPPSSDSIFVTDFKVMGESE